METTVVSSMGWSEADYIGPPDAGYFEAERSGLSQEGVTHHNSLPLAEVYDLMDVSDLFIRHLAGNPVLQGGEECESGQRPLVCD